MEPPPPALGTPLLCPAAGAARRSWLRPPHPPPRPTSPLLFSPGFRSALPQLFLITQHFGARTLPGPDRRCRCFPVPPPLSRRPHAAPLWGGRSISAPGDAEAPHPDPTAENGPLITPSRCCQLSPGTREATRGAEPRSQLRLSAPPPPPRPWQRGMVGHAWGALPVQCPGAWGPPWHRRAPLRGGHEGHRTEGALSVPRCGRPPPLHPPAEPPLCTPLQHGTKPRGSVGCRSQALRCPGEPGATAEGALGGNWAPRGAEPTCWALRWVSARVLPLPVPPGGSGGVRG